MRAAADAHAVGVIGNVADLVMGHPKPFAQQLREACLMTLAAAHGADDHLYETLGIDPNLCAFARDPTRHFDVVDDGNATAPMSLSRLSPALRKPVPARYRDCLAHASEIVTAVVGDPNRVFKWHLVGADKVFFA